jgi:hypothetical protein
LRMEKSPLFILPRHSLPLAALGDYSGTVRAPRTVRSCGAGDRCAPVARVRLRISVAMNDFHPFFHHAYEKEVIFDTLTIIV